MKITKEITSHNVLQRLINVRDKEANFEVGFQTESMENEVRLSDGSLGKILKRILTKKFLDVSKKSLIKVTLC